MTAVRTCRACGCWELQACEGGCSWISADRCSACPDAPLTLPINGEHLHAARWVQQVTYSWATPDSHAMKRLMLRCVEYPQLYILATARDGDLVKSEIYVGAMLVDPDAEADAIADLLNPLARAA